MDPQVVLARTPLGAEALEKHDHDLPRVLRHALILIDGRSTVAKLELEPDSQQVGYGECNSKTQAGMRASISRVDAEKSLTEPRDIQSSELRREV